MGDIYVRARGGLGNQMFQFAYAYALSKINNGNIVLDVREYSNYYWPFGLRDFFLTSYTSLSEEKSLRYDLKIKQFHLYQFLFKKFSKKELKPSKRLLKKGYIFSDIYCPDPASITKNKDLFLYGYFQDAQYLTPLKKDLQKCFSLKNVGNNLKRYLTTIRDDAIAVSMRFAENIELSKGEKYIYSDERYYESAIKYLFEKKGEKQLVIMSNDIDKARSVLNKVSQKGEIVFIEGLNAQEQIEVFKKCNDFVISNSTFAWWGAFLGSDKNSLIVSPKTWYQGNDISETHLFFEGMVFLD